MDKYIIETEATLVEVDGEIWALVLLAFDYGSPQAKTLVSDEIWRLLGQHDHLVTGMKRADGTFQFAVSLEFQEKIRARLSPRHKWTKVRLYPPHLPA